MLKRDVTTKFDGHKHMKKYKKSFNKMLFAVRNNLKLSNIRKLKL